MPQASSADPELARAELEIQKKDKRASTEAAIRAHEAEELSAAVVEAEKAKDEALAKAKEDLKERLRAATSDEERDRILKEAAEAMQAEMDALERQKRKQLDALR